MPSKAWGGRARCRRRGNPGRGESARAFAEAARVGGGPLTGVQQALAQRRGCRPPVSQGKGFLPSLVRGTPDPRRKPHVGPMAQEEARTLARPQEHRKWRVACSLQLGGPVESDCRGETAEPHTPFRLRRLVRRHQQSSPSNASAEKKGICRFSGRVQGAPHGVRVTRPTRARPLVDLSLRPTDLLHLSGSRSNTSVSLAAYTARPGAYAARLGAHTARLGAYTARLSAENQVLGLLQTTLYARNLSPKNILYKFIF